MSKLQHCCFTKQPKVIYPEIITMNEENHLVDQLETVLQKTLWVTDTELKY